MGGTVENLEITGDIMVSFRLEVSGDPSDRVVSDGAMYEAINKSVCKILEDAGLEINDSKIYNFDIYKEIKG